MPCNYGCPYSRYEDYFPPYDPRGYWNQYNWNRNDWNRDYQSRGNRNRNDWNRDFWRYTDQQESSEAVPAIAAQTDPPPLISNNPVVTNFVFSKQLTAYPNYGNPSKNADILYTGNTGTWSFETPSFIAPPGRQRAQLVIRAVLDDHANVPENSYSARITINGDVVHNGRVPLEHGTPAGGIFTNWRDLIFIINNPRRVNRVTIENTSSAGPNDWIGLDWMEIRLGVR